MKTVAPKTIVEWFTPKPFGRLTDRGLVAGRRDRDDLPHLTILWGTASGERDTHLNYEGQRGGIRYTSLLRVPKQVIAEAFEAAAHGLGPALEKFMVENLFAVRPKAELLAVMVPSIFKRRVYGPEMIVCSTSSSE